MAYETSLKIAEVVTDIYKNSAGAGSLKGRKKAWTDVGRG